MGRIATYARVLGWRGVVAGVRGKLSGRPVLHSVSHPKLRHPVTLRLPSTDVEAYEQVLQDEEYAMAVHTTPRVIVNAGANIGLASVYFASRFPEARVIAIECEAENFRLLQRNVAPYPNIEPVQAALWDHDGSIEVVDPGLGAWGFVTAESRHSGAGTVHAVPALTMATLMRRHGIEHIDVLKLDIEGAEYEVLASAPEWIDRVDTVVAELHERLKQGCESRHAEATRAFPASWERGGTRFAARARACVLAPEPLRTA
ncbi:MAG TPA: FkbM family methyltransferase [Methylibium sp.]|uniref:FkbM family methyltransferase n=1 Tax=Methylibium sp. TaxID=2067992 RepID=UPI002DC0014F|nr:FkbM family methyltransferase [Methylibium sp.]HEU4460120.1 FkbM family methyltransferase [Methylibium sp.]